MKRKSTLGCVSSLFLFGVAFAGVYLLVGRSLPFPLWVVFLVCALSAVFFLLAVTSFREAAARFRQAGAMRRRQLEGRHEAFRDGEKVIVFGRIHPLASQPIVSPFTRQPCVFYSYSVYRWVWRGTGESSERQKDTDYSGMWLIPSYVETPSGRVKLLAVPLPKGFEQSTFKYSDRTREVYERAFRFIQATSFEQIGEPSLTKAGEMFELVKGIVTDEDGFLRQDLQFSEQEFDLRSHILEETVIPAGEAVGLSGVWSADRGGVVTDLSQSAAEVFRGSPETVIRTAQREGWKKTLVGAFLLSAVVLILGVFWWILNIGPRFGTVTVGETRDGEVVWQSTLAPPGGGEEATAQPLSEGDAPAPAPTEEATQGAEPVAWREYANPAGGYRFEAPADWIIEETFGDDPNLPPSGWTRAFLGDQSGGFQWIGIDVSFERTGGGCPDIGFEATFGEGAEASERQIAGQTVRQYRRLRSDEVFGVYSSYAMTFAEAGVCYTVFLYDREGDPTQPVFDRILATFASLE